MLILGNDVFWGFRIKRGREMRSDICFILKISVSDEIIVWGYREFIVLGFIIKI